MGSKTTPFCREPTEALRERSVEKLRASLVRDMLASEPDVIADWEGVLMQWAAYFDCAERLGIDPVELFDGAARERSPELRSLAARFCRRSDVTLAAFGWTLVEKDGRPCYRPETFSLSQTRRTTRRDT
jgi:hypothetical protein